MVPTAQRPPSSRSLAATSRAQEPAEDKGPKDAPSSRPTSIPAFDVDAFAAASGLGCTTTTAMDARAVPVRTARAMSVATAFSLRQGFVFFHIDGHSSIAQITAATGMPAPELVGCFLELVALGAVELTSPASDARS